jgi:SAM-dependent methyltransferase
MNDLARRRARIPEAVTAILDARSLPSAHRRLAKLLEPGIGVLDCGCGTGAITRGMAEAVGPMGRVVGVDNNAAFIHRAHAVHRDMPRLWFLVADVYALPFQGNFDIVTASRVLQWLADPVRALRNMMDSAKLGGRIIVLDYNHNRIQWIPDPPMSMRTFYERFLGWRAEARLDNAIADNLSDLFRAAGLTDICVTPQHEITHRGDPQFAAKLRLWADVAASRGRQMVADGWITEAQRAAAEREYNDWIDGTAEIQDLYLLVVEGIRPQ